MKKTSISSLLKSRVVFAVKHPAFSGGNCTGNIVGLHSYRHRLEEHGLEITPDELHFLTSDHNLTIADASIRVLASQTSTLVTIAAIKEASLSTTPKNLDLTFFRMRLQTQIPSSRLHARLSLCDGVCSSHTAVLDP